MVSADAPRVGVLGSLCNPVHLGHLLLCQEATWQLGLSRVVLVPTGMPPHRPAPPESAGDAAPPRAGRGHRQPGADGLAHRDRSATARRTWSTRSASSPTRYPGNDLVLLLGSDQYAALSTWHEPERVRAARGDRGGAPARASRTTCWPMPPIERIEMPQVDISSSMIRERVAARAARSAISCPIPVRELIEAEGPLPR